MTQELEKYIPIVGEELIDQLRQLARPLAGMSVVHVNSTRSGGGVAEILNRMVPLQEELGINVTWEVLNGNEDFFNCTKRFHNGFQGNAVELPKRLLNAYEETNATNAERLRPLLKDADIVIIHDPQPAPLIGHVPDRKGKWFWRCHIDASRPYRPVWKYVRQFVRQYDASLWHLASFAQPVGHTQYLMPPSIDPLSEKNRDLDSAEVLAVCREYGIDTTRPMILQVSRFDIFKDPIGVIQAYKLVNKYVPHLQLVLAGGTADDDPEGAQVLAEVREAAGDDPDIYILNLPPDAHREINALQRAADIVLQKSLKEGFGLTVTEALWKGKPVIGGNVGGIRLQVVNHHTGFLVDSAEGAALRLRYLLDNRERIVEMGAKGQRFVLENFLLTRHLREYLTLMVAVLKGSDERIELA
jgi:trehalose synthase